MTIYPSPVKPGDTIGLVIPSSMITEETLQSVLAAANELGLNCKIGQTMQRAVRLFTAQQNGTIDRLLPTLSSAERQEYNRYIASGYMAGDPIGRADDINQFFADDDIAGIWCLRGGYSASKVLPYLDYELIRQHPKQIIGYSDITNIITAIYAKTGLVTYHGPMLAPNFTKPELLDNGKVDGHTLSFLGQFAMSNWDEITLTNPIDCPMTTMVGGLASGTICGGNLAVLSRLVGTPYAIDSQDKIVFLEEVRTHVVLCDMMLTQLQESGFFNGVRGLILGDFLDCHNRTGHDKCQDWLIDRVLHAHFDNAPFPVLSGVKLGHDKVTTTIPIGANCILNADSQQIVISKMV